MKQRPADLTARPALSRVDERIAAAVAEAPPLPDDLAARLAELIRTTPAATERTEAAACAGKDDGASRDFC